MNRRQTGFASVVFLVLVLMVVVRTGAPGLMAAAEPKVHDAASVAALPYTLSDIIIESNVMNTTKFVDFSPYVLARTIVIRNHCFAGVEQFSCFHLPNLKVLKIEDDSFNSSSPGIPIQDQKQRVCIIAYCDSLEKVEIGTNCFNWFSQLIVKGHILQDRFICRESAIAVVRSWPN